MRKTLLSLSLALLALGFFAGTPVAAAGKPPLAPEKFKIFFGGPVITMKDKVMPEAVAVSVSNGTIFAVGDDKAVMESVMAEKKRLQEQYNISIAIERVNLDGHTLLPGFVEPHTHLGLTVQTEPPSVYCGSQELNLKVEKVIGRLRHKAEELDNLAKAPACSWEAPDCQWVVGTNFDPSRSYPLFGSLDASELDKVSKTRPVFVLNASGHIAYVNHAAMRAAHPPITKDTKNPLTGGGEIVRDQSGEPTGQFNEATAINLVKPPSPPENDATRTLLHDQAACVIQQWAAAGVTTSTEIALGVTNGLATEWKLYEGLTEGPIRFRVYLDYNQVTANTDRSMRSRPTVPPSPEIVFKHNEGDDRLKVLGVKFVTDGSTQGFTAFLNAPYNYPKGTTNKGTFNFPLSEEKATKDNPTLLGVMRPFYNAGWQLVAHANGDAAIDKVLDAYETLFREEPALATPAARSSRRLRIEHFTVNDPDPLKMKLQLQRVHDLGVTPGMTAGHLYFWGQVFYQSILGPDRASKIHPSKSLKEKGIRFAYNSDSPITEVEPLRYVQTEGTRVPQWVPAQNPPFVLGADEISEDSVYDALRAVTLDAAYQVFFDDKVGSIEKGKLADFVVLAANPLTVPSSDIAGIKVLETYLGGERVYKQGDLCATGNRCAALLRACQPPDLGTK